MRWVDHGVVCALDQAPGFESEVRLWGLRMAAHHKGLSDSHAAAVRTEAIGRLLGIGELTLQQMSPSELEHRLGQALREAERARAPGTGPLARNLKRLAALVDLDELEREILAFATLMQETKVLRDLGQIVSPLTRNAFVHLLSAVLGRERLAIERALHSGAALASAGLIELGSRHSRYGDLDDWLKLLRGLGQALVSEREDIAEVFAQYFAPAPPARLALADYPHLAGDIETLARYLGAALASRARGVNALIYGPSGTGKTELARALAGALGVTLYEVSAEDEDGDPSEGRERLRAFRLCQRVLRSGAGQLVLFDEIEDVFPEDGAHIARYGREDTPPKDWLTRMLEQNAVPTLWLSNAVAHIDPALLRRFDYVLKAPIPPRSVRRAILEAELGSMALSVPWIGRMAETEHLAPADIARARKVGTLIAGIDAAANEAMLVTVLRGSLEVRGHSLAPMRAALGTLPFRLEYCATSVPLGTLVEGLARSRRGRVCLYGPPGTGKSAFAGHLAERLGRPLLEKRASDLLGMYVGETEAHIAQMFREAKEAGAVLLLDEADSFLRERRSARVSWEVTQVNELLKQMA